MEGIKSDTERAREKAISDFYEHYKRNAKIYNTEEQQARIAAGVPAEAIGSFQKELEPIKNEEKDRVWQAVHEAGVSNEEALDLLRKAVRDGLDEYRESLRAKDK